MADLTSTDASAVEAARARRAQSAADRNVEVEWFINEVSSKIKLPIEARVKVATEFLRDKIVQNISRPVTKTPVTGKKGTYTRITNRSKPGEYPKADTTQLMKSIFSVTMSTASGMYDGAIGTPIDYGVILELSMDRSFMVRTLFEERSKIVAILTGPIK